VEPGPGLGLGIGIGIGSDDPVGPRPVSAKAVYRLADKLDLPALKLRAFQHIIAGVTAQNIPAEVFSRFSSTFEDVRKVSGVPSDPLRRTLCSCDGDVGRWEECAVRCGVVWFGLNSDESRACASVRGAVVKGWGASPVNCPASHSMPEVSVKRKHY
jgi:hypothetical protein